MQKISLYITLLCLIFLTTLCVAQNVEVTGRVTGEGGTPIYGANVVVKGSRQGAVTDGKGDYRLQVAKGSMLTVSFIGYAAKDVVVGNSSVLNVSLAPQSSVLDEVVVTALGIKKEKRALGYAVSEVKGEELTQARTINLANNLQGRIAGVNISAPASGPAGSSRIVIRGNGSISGNNQPLIVVDGIPINNDNLGNAGMWGGGDRGDGISSLNPDEIETMTVLKGATAAALYGSRASNGAILVTTKGGKSGKGIGVEVNSNFVAEDILIKKFDNYQYEYGAGNRGIKPTTVQEALTSNSWGGKLDGTSVIQFDGKSRPYSAVRDNLTKFYQTGSTFTNSVALSGASENVTYRFSMNDLRNSSVVPNSGISRNNFAMNINGTLGKKLTFIANAKYIIEKARQRPRLSDSPGSATYALNALPTSLGVAALEESQVDSRNYELSWSDNIYVQNPYYAAYNWLNSDKKNRIIGTFEPRYDITDWLYVRGRIGFDSYDYRYQEQTPYGTPFSLRGNYNVTNRTFTETNTDLMLGIQKKLTERIGLNVLLGGNQMRQQGIFSNYSTGPLNIPFFYDISNSDPNGRGIGETLFKKRINSLYGSAEVSYNNYLYLTATARNDWFSTLATGKNSILYPSVGGSFVVSEAAKMPSFVNYLKLRSSWAQAGGDTDPYNLSLYYQLSGAHLGAPLAQISGGTVPNAALQPLTSTTFEAGLDTRLFNSRLGIDFAYYTRKTNNDIVGATISNTSGFSNALFNVGEIQNQGIELMLNYTVLKAKDFSWESSYNMGYNVSKVVNLYGNLTTLRVDESRPRSSFINHVVGLPYSQVQGFDYKRDAAGNIVHNDQGYPLQGDLKNFGTGVAPLTLGWSNSFRYKGVGLSFLIDGKFGGYLYSGTNAYAYLRGLSAETLTGREGGYVGVGVNEKGETNKVNVNPQDYAQRVFNVATPFIYKSDFLKLRQVIIDYTLPAQFLGTRSPIKGVSISLVGRNLAILMKKTPNIDPESTYNNSNAQGLELAGVPSTRSMGVNLNLKF